MTNVSDPTDPIRSKAKTFPAVAQGTSCNQTSFKAGKGAFLYIGPGAKGRGFKAMFKLERSMGHARKLATADPKRFAVGSTGWVTARFTVEEPLPESICEVWLEESYELACPSKAAEELRPAEGSLPMAAPLDNLQEPRALL